MKTLDLTRSKIRTMPIELDEIGVINVLTPTKATYEELIQFAPMLAELEKIDPDKSVDEVSGDVQNVISSLYDMISRIMNNNKEQRNIDASTLERVLPVEMCILFLNAYTVFLSEIQSERGKN